MSDEIEHPAASTSADDVAPPRAALVNEWMDRIQAAKKFHKEAFDRMEKAEQLATDGADEDWKKAKKYTVPIIARHINQQVAQLYAKDPRATAKRRRQLMFQLWDGDPQSYQAALEKVMPPMDPMGQPLPPPIDPMTGFPVPFQPDPNAMALVQEVQDAQAYDQLCERMAKTQEILWSYFTGEQSAGFKQSMKAVVRRAKVCGVGYVKLGFQRQLKRNPEIGAQIDDTTSQLASLEGLLKDAQSDTFDADSAKAEELRLLLQQLQDKEYLVVREGPVFDFPGAREIIPSTDCRHLKTFAGARWVAHEFDLSPEDIFEIYKVDVKDRYTAVRPDDRQKANVGAEKGKDPKLAKVYEIQDKKNSQRLVICEGYPDFLVEPSDPDVKLERFFTIFPLVFNEIENRKQLFPPSDVMLAQDVQKSYNDKRQDKKVHRRANRPKFVTFGGALNKPDMDKIEGMQPLSLLQLRNIKPGTPVSAVIQALPTVPIDPAQYDTNEEFSDLLRTVGSQEANLGGTSSSTATESSIAEQSRSASLSDNIDDLDDLLTELARATGQLMLLEMSKETVMEIVGPGAAWPDSPMTREDVAKELMLEIRAGSSGRKNQAADLAKWERATPLLMQLPDLNHKVLVQNIANLLDIDMEDLYLQGVPSITALNAVLGRGPQAPTGNPLTDPGQQGPQGQQNAPQPGMNEPGPQPAYPSSMPPHIGTA